MPSEPMATPPQHVRHGSNAGQPLTRREGVLKVTGRATYAADNHPANMLYAVTAVSRIARGRVTSLNIEAAKAAPGVVEVLTPAHRPPRTSHGKLDEGFAAATRVTEAEYTTPAQYHNAMEPHAVVAEWDGDRVTLDMPNQAMALSCASYGAFFGVPAENVLIRSPFLGGGFGSKAILNGPQILAILAARMVKRPVKLVLTRAQMYGPVGHRGETRQTLRLGTDGQGRF